MIFHLCSSNKLKSQINNVEIGHHLLAIYRERFSAHIDSVANLLEYTGKKILAVLLPWSPPIGTWVNLCSGICVSGKWSTATSPRVRHRPCSKTLRGIDLCSTTLDRQTQFYIGCEANAYMLRYREHPVWQGRSQPRILVRAKDIRGRAILQNF